jgi:hypothetical protein
MRTRLSQRLHVCTVFVGLWNLSRVSILWIYCCLSQERVIQHVAGSKHVDLLQDFRHAASKDTSDSCKLSSNWGFSRKVWSECSYSNIVEEVHGNRETELLGKANFTKARKSTRERQTQSIGLIYCGAGTTREWEIYWISAFTWTSVTMSNLLGKSRFDSPPHVYLTTIKTLCCSRLESKKWKFLHVACLYPLTCQT